MWPGDDVKKSDGGSDCSIKMEPGSKWRRNPSDMSDESDKSTSGKKNPVISQTGSWRRGMTAQVGITMPRTKPTTTTGTLKTPGTGESQADAPLPSPIYLEKETAATLCKGCAVLGPYIFTDVPFLG